MNLVGALYLIECSSEDWKLLLLYPFFLVSVGLNSLNPKTWPGEKEHEADEMFPSRFKYNSVPTKIISVFMVLFLAEWNTNRIYIFW